VDRVQPVVAVVLLDVVLAGVAVAPEHLDGEAVGLQAPLRRPALGDRREGVEQQVRALALLLRLGRLLVVDELAAVQDERQSALHVGLLGEQHPAHVGVLDDRHLRRGRVLAATGRPWGRSRAYCSDFR
jgi:hypothetical protein